jgi:hypothetical protein
MYSSVALAFAQRDRLERGKHLARHDGVAQEVVVSPAVVSEFAQIPQPASSVTMLSPRKS